MRAISLLLLAGLLAGCATKHPPPAAGTPLAAAEALIDAFYAFDPGRLRGALSAAPDSMPNILYYQGWAQGGNYVVRDRQPCRFEKADEIACSITVKDDLIAALGTGYDVTDTFHLTVADGRIVKVRTSSNDPPEFDRALDWLRAVRPQLMTGPCRGFFAGGPTPQACVREVVKGFAQFAARARR